MKKFTSTLLKTFSFCTLMFFFAGCVKDNCLKTYTYSYYVPMYKTTAEVKNNIKSNVPKDIVNPGKIVLLGNYIFLNEIDKGIHIIDNSMPASPRNVAFIDIPGNLDLAVKGNILYADLYTDLVTIDVADPMHAIVKKYNEGVFPFRAYGSGFYNDTNKIIVDWIKRDTTVTYRCSDVTGLFFQSNQYLSISNNSSGASSNSGSPIGKGGSMARFALVNNWMYTVSDNDLNLFNITNAINPVYSNKINVGAWNIETIFPFKDKLFVGSQNGMFVYNLNNPDNPVPNGEFSHVRSCDPVIADNNYAYVTLRSGSACQGFTNQLEVLKLNGSNNPQLVKTYSFTNPHGLSKDGNILFICDGIDGLKIYNASDVSNLVLIKQFTNLETYDVIAWNNKALVVAKDGLYQYDYTNVNNIHLLSKINLANK